MSEKNGNGERRRAKRSAFSCEIEYLAGGINVLRTGILENLSQTGAMVWLGDRIDIGTDLVLIAQPDREGELPIYIGVRVVRFVESRPDGMFGYGCTITSHSEEPF